MFELNGVVCDFCKTFIKYKDKRVSYIVVYRKDRLLHFCNSDCLKDFEKQEKEKMTALFKKAADKRIKE